MSASLAEKLLDSFHLFIELVVNAFAKMFALEIKLLLQMINFGDSACLHGLNLPELVLKLGEAALKACLFHWCIPIRWSGKLLQFLVKRRFKCCKLRLRDMLATDTG
eukprot:s2528_g4.t1